MQTRILNNEQATEEVGAELAAVMAAQGAMVITLSGDLGAGKTTLVRGLLRALGHVGAVKSPTYTLIEPYDLSAGTVLHLDLYRLAGATDIEGLGLREQLDESTAVLIEWPERAAGGLPEADLHLELTRHPEGRALRASARSPKGHAALARIFPSN